MPLLDFSKNCDISTISFVDDLKPYSLGDNSKIIWSDDSSNPDPPIYTIKNNTNLFDSNETNNYWTPNFITSDELIDNKIISNYGSVRGDYLNTITSGRIGIEDFITFNGKFKNWDTNGKMGIDWILNRSRIPYTVIAGLSYWKIKSLPLTGKIEIFPVYSKIKHIDSNNTITEYIKLDNNTLRKASVRNSVFQNHRVQDNNSPITFQYDDENANTSVSSLGDNPTFTLLDSDKVKIWIADGDQLLYFLNNGEKTKNYINKIGSRSYISGSLYKYYNIFYNVLTANEKTIRIGENRSVNKLRLYKKLAHSLATSPFASEFFVSFLAKPSKAIQKSIKKYIESEPDDINKDIKNLKDVLCDISKEYSIYEISNNENIIINNNQLFVKLINKYGAKLILKGNDAYVNYSKKLKYGDSILVEDIGETLVEKNIEDKILINNKKIITNKLILESNLGDQSSRILLKTKMENGNDNIVETIPLYNSVKPDIKPTSSLNILLDTNTNGSDHTLGDDLQTNIFYWDVSSSRIEDNKENWIKYAPRLSVLQSDLLIKYLDPKLPNQAYDLVSNEFFCTWEKVSGPPLKFVDLGKTQTNKKYDRAYGPEVLIVPSSTGRYVIKCTISGPFGSYTKIKTIFIVDGRKKLLVNDNLVDNPYYKSYSKGSVLDDLFNFYSRPVIDNDFSSNRLIADITSIRTTYGSENAPIFLNTDKLNVYIAGFDACAIHCNGLYSPIKTNYYVEKIPSNNRIIEKLNDTYKFLYGSDINPVTENSNLRINYSCGETILKLDRIILKNIRNQSDECSQCYSLYKPRFKSEVAIFNSRPRFQRTNKNPDDFSLQKYLFVNQNNLNQFDREYVKSYGYPEISSDYAPKIKTCGGYGDTVLNKIPISADALITLDRPEQININSGYVSKKPKNLPATTGYNLAYKDDYITLDERFRDYKFCYQQHIMPKGYIEFTKGCFIPESGWVDGDSKNLSSVLKFNPGARKSFNFMGPGILGLSNYTNEAQINASIFSSTIELNINPIIRWDTGGGVSNALEGEALRNRIAEVNGEHFIKNQLSKELSDQYFALSNQYHHGYRILNGGQPKSAERNLVHNSVPQNDEFDINIDENSNKFIYSFNVVGPNNPIGLSAEATGFIDLYVNQGVGPGSNGDGLEVRNYIEANKGFGLRNPRINDLSIKDIEVQLNFLNYVNTKNLAVWLEVKYSARQNTKIAPTNTSIPDQIISENIFIDQFLSSNTHGRFDTQGLRNSFVTSDEIPITNTNIKNYLKNLVDNNSKNNPGEGLVLFLLNQETIQNKEYNFSVKFSDTADKHTVFFDHNLFSSGIVDAEQKIINNNNEITPTKNAILEDTHSYTQYSNFIKFNNLNINNNTFNKFRGKKLFEGLGPPDDERMSYPYFPYDSSTSFTLHIAVLEEEDEMFPMDTLINNELYSNLSDIENKPSSANLFNNLCSWELILHTEDVKKPITKQVTSLASYGGADALSSIEYGSNPKYPGYGFIANLKDSKFLLPLVNMNAPTTFFQNYNACEYADNELIGKGAIIRQPRFPVEALLFIATGTAVGGMTGTLVGALVGGLGPTYYLGFEAIYDYYRQSRTVPVLELAQRETFDIDYESYPFGDSDKILINASKDGVFWYKMEASIFKLSNTPALPLKQYTFAKNKSKLFKFTFDIVLNNSDIIDEIFIPYIVAKATPDNTDEDTINMYKNIDNNIYRDFDFITVNEFISYNKLIHSKNIFNSKKDNKVLIMIDHTMPYHLISIGDSISLDKEPDPLYVKVESKALIYKGGSYKTVLGLDTNISTVSAYSQFYLPDNVVVIFDNNFSAIDNSQESSVSLFGLSNDQPPLDEISDHIFSTNSLGSYGDGSSIKNKNILSKKIKVNNLNPIYKQLNSFNNDKYYYNQIKITLPNSNTDPAMAPDSVSRGVPISINTSFEAYPIYYDDKINKLIDNQIYSIIPGVGTELVEDNIIIQLADLNKDELEAKLNNINTSTKDYRTYSNDHKYNMMYLKIKDDKITSLFRNALGSMTIENNYTYFNTIERITTDQLKILTDRLDKLNVTEDASLDPIIGIESNTANILNKNSIYYIQKHYDSLPEDRPDCTPTTNCHKSRTYSKLQKLYYERTKILELLENQAIKKAKIFKTKEDYENNTNILEDVIETDTISSIKLKNNRVLNKNNIYKILYIYELDPLKQRYHTGSGGIIPDYKAIITTDADKFISIEYEKISDNYYWINIDPKQSCSIAEEMRPRILKSIQYVCESTNPNFSAVGGGVEISDFNNICPDWTKVGGKESDSFKIESSPNGTTYNIKQEVIDQQKQDWVNKVYGWKTQTISRKFRIISEQTTKNILPNVELLVTSIETYEVGLSQLEAEEIGAQTALAPNQVIPYLIEEGLIKNDFSGDILLNGLLNGIGMNLRNNKPTRVHNVFNLDDVSNLKIQFRKTPRLMRGIDAIGTVLRYGESNSYRPQNRPPLDPLDIWGVGRTESLINNFYLWKCYQKDPSQDRVVDAETPDFFRLLNEMAFRTFFGSVDEIEHKTPQLKSLYDFEMIPYEYFVKPPENPPAP